VRPASRASSPGRDGRSGGRGEPAAGAPGYELRELGPTARAILAAALRVLERDGFAGLTLRRIAAEAGETKSLIIYHFGDKDGLLAALVDSLWHDEDMDLVRRLARLPDAPADRLRALIDAHHALALETREYRMYFDLLPRLLRHSGTRRRHAELNRTYRTLGATAMPDDETSPGDRIALASLLLAVDEGAAALLQLDRDGFDHERAFALLQELAAAHAGTASVAKAGSPVVPGAMPADGGDPGALFNDPAADLAPVARRLLEAALRVFASRGLSAVTFDAIARASGEPSSATTYYFGEKRNLIVAMNDTLLARAQRTALRYLRTPYRGDGHPLAALPLVDPGVLRSMRGLYEMFPEIVRDDELLDRHAAFVAWLRAAAGAACRGSDAAWSPALVDLTLAVAYGLPIQLLIDRDALDPAPVLDAWRGLVAAFAAG